MRLNPSRRNVKMKEKIKKFLALMAYGMNEAFKKQFV